MIVLYADHNWGKFWETIVVGVAASVDEARQLCQAYATQRVIDNRQPWYLRWVEVSDGLTAASIREIITSCVSLSCEGRLSGDDATPEEAQAVVEEARQDKE